MADELLELIRSVEDQWETKHSIAPMLAYALRANSALLLKEIGVHAGWSQPGKWLGEYVYSLTYDGHPEWLPKEIVPLYAAKEGHE